MLVMKRVSVSLLLLLLLGCGGASQQLKDYFVALEPSEKRLDELKGQYAGAQEIADQGERAKHYRALAQEAEQQVGALDKIEPPLPCRDYHELMKGLFTDLGQACELAAESLGVYGEEGKALADERQKASQAFGDKMQRLLQEQEKLSKKYGLQFG